VPTTENETSTIVHSLRSMNSCGHHKASSKIVKSLTYLY